ncbi:hypothetical protein Hsw_2802 [Hymenobacter swuensis DY53]|uniref:Uncharacterized protein n=1 Tax=Hymenobacter swuensis DY53 TaxID=1227739 RepID=W8F304_9BACT|nr:hypothetical protein Hsw_2802 [Hymenobacter swuensis DY53]
MQGVAGPLQDGLAEKNSRPELVTDSGRLFFSTVICLSDGHT